MSKNEQIRSMLTATEVARFLNVHINTVRRWSNRGTLRTYRIGSRGDRRFERLDVVNLVLEQPELAKAEANKALALCIGHKERLPQA
jgi:excisionase family DNA binding protein